MEITPADGLRLANLGFPDPNHRDPFDRLLVSQALERDLTLVSNEAKLDAYGVKRIW